MFRATKPGWLTDLLDRAFSGHVLQRNECQELAAGFVGCNLVANLTEFVANIGNAGPGSVFGGQEPPSFANLRGWLNQPPPDWKSLTHLTGPRGAAAMAGGPHHFDPWWQIDRWLGIEAFLHLLAPRLAAAGPPPSAFGPATATAEGVPAVSRLQPPPCRQRNPAVAQAFATWWHATVECLVRLWRQHDWHQQVPLVRQQLGGLLARELGTACQPLATLVGTRNNQLGNCLQQLNQARGGPCPTPDGWLALLGSQVVAAWEADDDFGFTQTDLQHLHTLAGWLPTVGLAPCELDLRTVFAGFLTPPAVEAVFPNTHLQEVVVVLNQLLAAIPIRGLPSNWSVRPLVPDLFAYPVHPGFDFAVWASTLNRLFGIPRQP
jgi:hypothetical protein